MRLMLHIFKKDVRRLWWQIIVTLVLLAALRHADWIPSSTEGWLNLLLPLAWAGLIALVVHEEPLVGDRQFWVTRPYHWPSLLASKALFVVLFIHLPSFLTDGALIAARGFNLLESVSQLLWKQVLLAAALTLPALALAAIVRNLMQFVFIAVLAPAVIIFLAGSVHAAWIPVDEMRHYVTIVLLALAAIAIVLLQYCTRRTTLSRILGVAAGLIAGALFVYISPEYTFTLRSAISPAHAELSLHLAPRQEELPRGWAGSPNRVTVALPIAISGIPESARARFEQLALEIVGPNGDRYRTAKSAVYAPFEKVMLEAYFLPSPFDNSQTPTWLILRFDRSAYDRLKAGTVKVTGKAAVAFYRVGETRWVTVGVNEAIPGIGRCSSVVVEDRYSNGMLKVLCESPSEIAPLWTQVKLLQPDTGQEWKQRLGDSSTVVPGPRQAWLSPLARRQTFFRLTEEQPKSPGSQWLVPRSVLATAKIAITPEPITGYSTFNYTISYLTLSSYVLKR